MGESNLSSTKLTEKQNHDDYNVIWLGSNNNIPNEENIVDYLEKFVSVEECFDHITDIKSERKILLVLTEFFECLVHFDELDQIHSIYLLEKNGENINFNQAQSSKMVNIFRDEHTLIERLRQDILLTYRNDFSINISSLREITIEQSLTSLDENSLMFVWNQLFIYYLVNSSHINMEILKKEMIEQCLLEYKNDPIELKKINEFDNECTSDNVLYWYTRDSFVYRLLNKSFRTRNIHLICKFRYFIILLYKKLKELSIQQRERNRTVVYRGQSLKIDQLEILLSNIGNLISTNTMFSTTKDRNVAQVFLGSDEVNVLYEIKIENTNVDTIHVFADISQLSQFPEEEVLFFAGAVFRIDSIQQDNESIWIIKLTLTNETGEQLEQIMKHVEYQFTHTSYWQELHSKINDFRLIGSYYNTLTNKVLTWKDALIKNIKHIDIYYLLKNLGNYEKLIEYYEKLLLMPTFIDKPKSIVLNVIIGYNYFHLLKYEMALDYYNAALLILDDEKTLKGQIFHHIGDAYKMKNNFNRALFYYRQALDILCSQYSKKRCFPILCREIADIHKKQNNDTECLSYEKRADKYDKSFRQTSQLDYEKVIRTCKNRFNTELHLLPLERAEILFTMGLTLIKQCNYHKALESLLKAKQLFKDHLPPHGQFVRAFSKLFESIAIAYVHLKDYFNALLIWKRAIDSRRATNACDSTACNTPLAGLQNSNRFTSSDYVRNLLDPIFWVNTPGGNVSYFNLSTTPALAGIGIAFSLAMLEPCGIILPHIHSRGSKGIYSISGKSLLAGFIQENKA
ncbi:unnamed protein product [Adineta steineri]|uniref:Cupin type-1 domain-containing protein n=1 Tax=Adineta steineri TaxID=433720 RepID=A0A813UF73_9BILA|nr:unnamed protein product [Adineta steineri]